MWGLTDSLQNRYYEGRPAGRWGQARVKCIIRYLTIIPAQTAPRPSVESSTLQRLSTRIPWIRGANPIRSYRNQEIHLSGAENLYAHVYFLKFSIRDFVHTVEGRGVSVWPATHTDPPPHLQFWPLHCPPILHRHTPSQPLHYTSQPPAVLESINPA